MSSHDGTTDYFLPTSGHVRAQLDTVSFSFIINNIFLPQDYIQAQHMHYSMLFPSLCVAFSCFNFLLFGVITPF